MGFKDNLKDEMYYQDIKIKELSDKTGISVNTIRNYINGHNALPNVESGVKIANALNTSVEELVNGRNSHNRQESDSMRQFIALFLGLTDNDKKSVLALMKEMKTHN